MQEFNTNSDRLTIATLVRYLLGYQNAIQAVARSKSTFWLGLLFVLSTGFAREYDGEDLLAQPWHIFLPLAASLATSFVLYLLVYTAVWFRSEERFAFFAGYRQFLSFYWLTAPLAWLYAIPVERFFSAGIATWLNLCFLAMVAAWRVLLISRVLSVWLGVKYRSVFVLVMLFSDTLALILVTVIPAPIFSLMGGIRHTPSEILIHDAISFVQVTGVLSFLVWLIGSITVLSVKSRWEIDIEYDTSNSRGTWAKSVWGLAIIMLLIWAAILPFTQPEQQRRFHVEQLIQEMKFDEAMEYLSQYEKSDFPPGWSLPPRIGYGETTPSPFDLYFASIKPGNADWVENLAAEKLKRGLENWRGFTNMMNLGDSLCEKRIDSLLDTLEARPGFFNNLVDMEGIVHHSNLNSLLRYEKLTPKQRERITILIPPEEPEE